MAAKDRRPRQLDGAHYPLHLQLRYRAYHRRHLMKIGTGETIFIGAKDVLFWAEEDLEAGLQAELSIDWPVSLEGRTRLQLCISGEIESSNAQHVLVRTLHYDLKLRASLAKGAGV